VILTAAPPSFRQGDEPAERLAHDTVRRATAAGIGASIGLGCQDRAYLSYREPFSTPKKWQRTKACARGG